MAVSSILNHSNHQSYDLEPQLDKTAIPCRLRVVKYIFACLALVSAPAFAQQPTTKPTLVPGSKVNLSSVMAAEWIQGEAPKSLEPGKVYMFECWATWCGPCIALIPHVNELHERYYDKGLRVYGMNCWEDGKDAVEKFVQKKGKGMSYPVAYTGEKSAFATEWLDAAGANAIPYAFIVRDGKLLLGTEASRLTNSIIEQILSGDEGAKQAAAVIQAAQDNYGKTEGLIRKIDSARRAGDEKKMAANLKELETIDPNHPELSTLKLKLLVTRKDWPAALKAFNEMPSSNSKNSYVSMTGMRMAGRNQNVYPMDFMKAVTAPYAKYVNDGERSVGPNHYACLSILQWRTGEKEAAAMTAEKGVEVAKSFLRASEARTNAFKRFAKSVKDGKMPKFSDLSKWQREAK